MARMLPPGLQIWPHAPAVSDNRFATCRAGQSERDEPWLLAEPWFVIGGYVIGMIAVPVRDPRRVLR